MRHGGDKTVKSLDFFESADVEKLPGCGRSMRLAKMQADAIGQHGDRGEMMAEGEMELASHFFTDGDDAIASAGASAFCPVHDMAVDESVEPSGVLAVKAVFDIEQPVVGSHGWTGEPFGHESAVKAA